MFEVVNQDVCNPEPTPSLLGGYPEHGCDMVGEHFSFGKSSQFHQPDAIVVEIKPRSGSVYTQAGLSNATNPD